MRPGEDFLPAARPCPGVPDPSGTVGPAPGLVPDPARPLFTRELPDLPDGARPIL